MPGYFKANNGWQNLFEVKAKKSGAWQTVQKIYAKQNGVWTEVYVRAIATTTTLTSSTTSIYSPDSFTLSGAVTATQGTPTGTVAIDESSDGGTTWNQVGTATLSAGAYTYTRTPTAAATTAFTYRARYLGNAPYTASTSSTRVVTYRVYIPTTLTIGSVSSDYTFTSVNLSATLQVTASSAALAGQTITFKQGTTVLGTATTNASGVATFAYGAGYAAGTYTFSAEYAGSGDYVSATPSSTSATYSLRTTTAVMATVPDTYYNENYTQTVTLAVPGTVRYQFQYSGDTTWYNADAVTTTTTTASYTTLAVGAVTGDQYKLRAYREADGYYAEAMSNEVTVTFLKRATSVTITITSGAATTTAGASLSFSATVKDVRANQTLGATAVVWDNTWRGQNGTYNSRGTGATLTYAGSRSYTMRATYNATGIYLASSATQVVYMLESMTGDASSSRSYNSSGDLRVENGTTDYAVNNRMYHGYYSSTQGDQRSAIWFEGTGIDWTRVNGCYSVASAYLNILRSGSAGNSTNTTFYAGTHTDASVSNTWSGISGKSVRLTSKQLDWNQDTGATGWEMGSTARTNFKGTARGVVIGNANSTSISYYGYLIGANVTGQPYLTINFYDQPA